MELDRRRWIVIAAGVFANLCQGVVYAFSVFAAPLALILKSDMAHLSLAFSLSVGFLPLGMLLAGKLSARRGPTFAVVLGGGILGVGMLLAGFTNSLLWLYLTYGVMISIGNGTAYGTVVSTAVEWFPDRRGLASGIVVSASGIGTLIFARVAQPLIDAIGVLHTFKVLGVGILVVIGLAAPFIKRPPGDYKPEGFNSSAVRTRHHGRELAWNQMIRSPRFWLLHVLYATGVFAGMIVISQAKFIASESIHDISKGTAATLVGILGLANSSGRFFWGGISDRIGRYQALILMFLITAIAMFLFSSLATTFVPLVVIMFLVGLCYGGYLGVFPSITADTFGSRNLTINYALMFTAFGATGVLAPWIGGSIKDAAGSYGPAYAASGIVASVGLILTIIARVSDVKRVKDTHEEPVPSAQVDNTINN